MQLKSQSKNADKYGGAIHGTLEDVSWDLGSLEHRVGQLEDIVEQIKADISKLREELSDGEPDRRPSKADSSIPFKNNGHKDSRRLPSAEAADS